MPQPSGALTDPIDCRQVAQGTRGLTGGHPVPAGIGPGSYRTAGGLPTPARGVTLGFPAIGPKGTPLPPPTPCVPPGPPPPGASNPFRWVLAVLLPLSLLLAAAVAFGAQPQPREFVFPERNRLYPDLQVTLEPVQWGPMFIRLSSPEASLRISEHRIRLTPRPDGSHDAWAELQFSGTGTLVADLEVAGLSTRQTDQVLLPRQSQILQGTVRLERGPSDYLVTPLEMPRQIQLQIKSRLAGDLANWCASIPLISLTGADCSGLRNALSQVSVPLPAPGETYLLPYTELTPEERRALDGYLDEAAPR